MKREKLTMSQALVKFLDNQYIECDGEETKFVSGIFGIFGHGCVVGVGQALEQGGHNLKFYQGKNEQNMALGCRCLCKADGQKSNNSLRFVNRTGSHQYGYGMRLRNGKQDSASCSPGRHFCLPPARSRASAGGVFR